VPLKRGILQLAFMALLLIGQQAALVHALHHLATPPGSKSQTSGKTPGTDSALCAFHVACAQVLGGVNATGAPLRLAANVFEQFADRQVLRFGSSPLNLRSRSPPVLL
jgi:hypothetical protein